MNNNNNKKTEIKLQQLFGQQVGGSNFFMAKFLQLMQMITRVQSLNKFMAVILSKSQWKRQRLYIRLSANAGTENSLGCPVGNEWPWGQQSFRCWFYIPVASGGLSESICMTIWRNGERYFTTPIALNFVVLMFSIEVHVEVPMQDAILTWENTWRWNIKRRS